MQMWALRDKNILFHIFQRNMNATGERIESSLEAEML